MVVCYMCAVEVSKVNHEGLCPRCRSIADIRGAMLSMKYRLWQQLCSDERRN